MKSTLFLALACIAAHMYLPRAANAAECVMTVTREACPGHETSCYSKCNGQPTCDETKKVGSKDACEKEAIRNCTVFRPGETKTKKVSAKLNGEALNGGADFCSPAKPEYNFNTCN